MHSEALLRQHEASVLKTTILPLAFTIPPCVQYRPRAHHPPRVHHPLAFTITLAYTCTVPCRYRRFCVQLLARFTTTKRIRGATIMPC
jgi:hypothetical protein